MKNGFEGNPLRALESRERWFFTQKSKYISFNNPKDSKTDKGLKPAFYGNSKRTY